LDFTLSRVPKIGMRVCAAPIDSSGVDLPAAIDDGQALVLD